ncbi:hypothetical protein EGW08_014049, partial [Elysia chlorotica]
MQPLVLLPILVSMASANSIMNNILLNVLTQGMDPISRSFMKSTLGTELFDMDPSSGGSGGGVPYGMEGLVNGISNQIAQSMFKPPQWGPNSGYNPSTPTFATTNIVTPSANKPPPTNKGANFVNPYNSAPFAVSPRSSSRNVMSPAAPLPIGPTPPSVTSLANPTPTPGPSGPAQISFSSGTNGLVAPNSGMSTAPTRRANFFETFMMMRMMQMMDF